MPLLKYFTLDEIDTFESDELQGWLAAAELSREKERVELLAMLPYASTTFKNQLRIWQKEVTKGKREIQVQLGVYHAQKSNPMDDNERRNLFKGGKRTDRSNIRKEKENKRRR